MDGHRTQLRFVDSPIRLRRLVSRVEIGAWLRERSAALEALLQEQRSYQLTLDERQAT